MPQKATKMPERLDQPLSFAFWVFDAM
uniref:Uncharacterized protein n=1 Tax=Moniliophthora roreri TaxID=221103 RepID=A0A0W0FBN8_MONRR